MNDFEIELAVYQHIFDLAKQVLAECRNNKNAFNFDRFWINVLHHEKIQSLLPHAKDQYQHQGYEFILYAITTIFRLLKIRLVPIVRHDDQSNERFAGSEGILILGLHGGFAPNAKNALDAGRKIAFMSDVPSEVERCLYDTGVKSSNVEVFPHDRNAFLHVKKFLREKYVIFATVDFRRVIPGQFNLISPSFFEFAKKTQTPLYFGASIVSNDGVLHGLCKGGYLGSSMELIDQFEQFQKVYRPDAVYEIQQFDHQKNMDLIKRQIKRNM